MQSTTETVLNMIPRSNDIESLIKSWVAMLLFAIPTLDSLSKRRRRTSEANKRTWMAAVFLSRIRRR